MKTVDVVKMDKGWHVTRRYFSQNKGTQFFPSVAPTGMKKTEAKDFLKKSAEAKQKFIKEWVGE